MKSDTHISAATVQQGEGYTNDCAYPLTDPQTAAPHTLWPMWPASWASVPRRLMSCFTAQIFPQSGQVPGGSAFLCRRFTAG